MARKKKATTKAKTKANGKSNGKSNGESASKVRKAPDGAVTFGLQLWPEHQAIVAALANRDGVSRAQAARVLIEQGKTAMKLRVPRAS